MNPVLDLIYKHKSIRKYKNQPIEDEKLHAIIKAAQSAQNWCNGQHVSIIAIVFSNTVFKISSSLLFNSKLIL